MRDLNSHTPNLIAEIPGPCDSSFSNCRLFSYSCAPISFLNSKGAVGTSHRDGGVTSVFEIIPSFLSNCSQGEGLLMCNRTVYQVSACSSGCFYCLLFPYCKLFVHRQIILLHYYLNSFYFQVDMKMRTMPASIWFCQ